MARRNADLIDDIKVIDAEAVTEGLKNPQLEALLKVLKDKALEESNNGGGVDPKPEQAIKESEPGHCVAPGKSITSKRGIKTEGDTVSAEYFSGGQETFDDLIERGFVVKK